MNSKSQTTLDMQAIENFREYLRIPSVHPNINYDACVNFVQTQAKELDLPVRIVTVAPNKPVVIITWEGTNPSLPSILLNSHMDVVPVYPEKWNYDPFGAHMDEKGNIYARGAQDMKCVGIQYLEAIRRLKLDGIKLKRTIHVSFVPDEEIGGKEGMAKFVETPEFETLNIGFAMDEAVPSKDQRMIVHYAEKSCWQFRIRCLGQPGHGSLLPENTASEKAAYILNKVYEYRRQEKQKLPLNDPLLSLGNVTSINLTQMKGGVQRNVIPSEIELIFDCRLTPTVDFVEWERMVAKWCEEAGPDVHVEFIQKDPSAPVTQLDNSNPYWCAFKQATEELGLQIVPTICPGATDARYMRIHGIPAIGFSPINHTQLKLHADDEYLNKDIFLKGINIIKKILINLGSLD